MLWNKRSLYITKVHKDDQKSKLPTKDPQDSSCKPSDFSTLVIPRLSRFPQGGTDSEKTQTLQCFLRKHATELVLT